MTTTAPPKRKPGRPKRGQTGDVVKDTIAALEDRVRQLDVERERYGRALTELRKIS